MKRTTWVVIVASLVLAVSGISLAEGPDQMGGQHQMMGQQQMSQGMRGGMMNTEMVAVSDGVIVLIGNKLYKYDKDLNLKKEVEIKMPKKEAP